MAHKHPEVLRALADRYRASHAGRTGANAHDFTIDYLELLKAARATDGNAFADAERCLREAEQQSAGQLSLDLHPHDDRLIHRVRLAREGGEVWLFATLGESTPAEERLCLAALLRSHRETTVPSQWREHWHRWLDSQREAALQGSSVLPLDRHDLALTQELLVTLANLLAWEEKSLLRLASCVLCQDSKRLEQLQPRLESALHQISEGVMTTLDDLGITDKPRAVRLCGPLKLTLPEGCLDLGWFKYPITISEEDIRRAISLTSLATRVLSVENDTTFTELAKRAGDTLLIQTSYPGRGVLALYERLPIHLEFWHFGDSDPSGFDILRDLRERTGRAIRPLHMQYRPLSNSEPLGKDRRAIIHRLLVNESMKDCHSELIAMQTAASLGQFEQEMLGLPTLQGWPFYPQKSG